MANKDKQTINHVQFLISALAWKGFNFTLIHKAENRTITITAVKDCDFIKSEFMEFEIKQDDRMRRYCELVVNYTEYDKNE